MVIVCKMIYLKTSSISSYSLLASQCSTKTSSIRLQSMRNSSSVSYRAFLRQLHVLIPDPAPSEICAQQAAAKDASESPADQAASAKGTSEIPDDQAGSVPTSAIPFKVENQSDERGWAWLNANMPVEPSDDPWNFDLVFGDADAMELKPHTSDSAVPTEITMENKSLSLGAQKKTPDEPHHIRKASHGSTLRELPMKQPSSQANHQSISSTAQPLPPSPHPPGLHQPHGSDTLASFLPPGPPRLPRPRADAVSLQPLRRSPAGQGDGGIIFPPPLDDQGGEMKPLVIQKAVRGSALRELPQPAPQDGCQLISSTSHPLLPLSRPPRLHQPHRSGMPESFPPPGLPHPLRGDASSHVQPPLLAHQLVRTMPLQRSIPLAGQEGVTTPLPPPLAGQGGTSSPSSPPPPPPAVQEGATTTLLPRQRGDTTDPALSAGQGGGSMSGSLSPLPPANQSGEMTGPALVVPFAGQGCQSMSLLPPPPASQRGEMSSPVPTVPRVDQGGRTTPVPPSPSPLPDSQQFPMPPDPFAGQGGGTTSPPPPPARTGKGSMQQGNAASYPFATKPLGDVDDDDGHGRRLKQPVNAVKSQPFVTNPPGDDHDDDEQPTKKQGGRGRGSGSRRSRGQVGSNSQQQNDSARAVVSDTDADGDTDDELDDALYKGKHPKENTGSSKRGAKRSAGESDEVEPQRLVKRKKGGKDTKNDFVSFDDQVKASGDTKRDRKKRERTS
jgi:hypothetical protein